MQATAKLRYARISPQKCRLVADLVRGRPVGSALGLLKFTPQKGAALVLKVLESAIANAEHNLGAVLFTTAPVNPQANPGELVRPNVADHRVNSPMSTSRTIRPDPQRLPG